MKKFATALVLGLGASGHSAARLLQQEGARVTVVDKADTDELRQRGAALTASGARVLLGVEALPPDSFEVCIVSPGVAFTSPWLEEMRRRGIPIVPEFELGWSRLRCPVIAVTGTNGKSTAVKWLVESLEEAGQRAAPAGNYGLPVTQAVLDAADVQWLVVEVSSFQLEASVSFRAEVGVLLNLLPNHLDRHGEFAAYERAKARLFANTRPADACIVHEPHARRIRELAGGQGMWHTFGTSDVAEYVYRDGHVLRGGVRLADLRDTPFENDVLGCNAAGVIAALETCAISLDAAVRAALRFKTLPHRMEQVAVIRGVAYVNDSKATTLSALAAALRMCKGRVRLIAGGLLKESDLTFVKENLVERAAAVYLIGRASRQLASAWSSAVPCVCCGTLEKALADAARDARAGETVLLSPGCASFDQFRDYADRGEQFRKQVQILAGEK